MKLHLASVLLTAASCIGAQAQSVWPEALNGAAFGAGLGAIIGGSSGNYHHGPYGGHHHGGGNAGQGAAIGAGVGLVAGALFGLANRQQANSAQAATWAYTPTPQAGYGYVPAYSPAPLQPAYAPPASQPNYIVGGTVLGAASGALIGQGVNCKPGVGAAIGAGSGLVIGAIAQAAARNGPQQQTLAVQNSPPSPAQNRSADTTQSSEHPQAAPQRSPDHSGATPSHQIPDAPRVPDAPTF